MIAPLQYRMLGATALLAVLLVSLQTKTDRAVFTRFFGPIHPAVAMAAVAAAAFVALPYLLRKGGLEVVGPDAWRAGLRFTVSVAPLFAVAAVAADLVLRYPRDMNVEFPDALLFYPAIGYAAEVVLHVVPLALLVAGFARDGIRSERTFWALAFPVALLEAGFQAATATSTATAVFSGVQLLAFGLVQLHVFRRFGFMSMYTFRLFYYLLWHIVWGSVRLSLLF